MKLKTHFHTCIAPTNPSELCKCVFLGKKSYKFWIPWTIKKFGRVGSRGVHKVATSLFSEYYHFKIAIFCIMHFRCMLYSKRYSIFTLDSSFNGYYIFFLRFKNNINSKFPISSTFLLSTVICAVLLWLSQQISEISLNFFNVQLKPPNSSFSDNDSMNNLPVSQYFWILPSTDITSSFFWSVLRKLDISSIKKRNETDQTRNVLMKNKQTKKKAKKVYVNIE